ncbi:MAG: hypothetical protein ACRDWS_08900 [Acidimicrobiia bacterium]
MARKPPAATVGLVALAVAALFSVRVLAAVGWDPTVFVAFGEGATATTQYAEERLGTVYLRGNQGHDGKYFFVQAHDPLLLEPAANAKILDRPLYRSQRMLYPLIAGGFGLFDSDAIVWAMLVVNLIAMSCGTYATARVAQQMGGSAWWGLAFAFNIGLISELNIGGAGALATALAFGAVAAIREDRDELALILLSLSALAREVMLIVGLGIACWLWMRGKRRKAARFTLVPIAVFASWVLYAGLRVGWSTGLSQAGAAFDLPFVGVAKALPGWLGSPLDMVAGLATLFLVTVYSWRTVRSGALVGWAFLGLNALVFVLSELVWTNYFDITRAVAPAITAFVLMMFLADRTIIERR